MSFLSAKFTCTNFCYLIFPFIIIIFFFFFHCFVQLIYTLAAFLLLTHSHTRFFIRDKGLTLYYNKTNLYDVQIRHNKKRHK